MRRFLLNDWVWVCGATGLLVSVHLAWGETGANILAGLSVVGTLVLCVLSRRRETRASASPAGGRPAEAAALAPAVLVASSRQEQPQTLH
jgi:hypothetical protein